MIQTKLKNIVLMLLACVMLVSCAGNKQGSGAAIGALAGGLLGSQFGGGAGKIVAIGVGAVAGGLIGSSIGKNMDEHDKMMAEKTAQNALESAPSGKAVEWHNPDNGHRGTVTPIRTVKESGRYCREYTQTVTIGGKAEKAYGKACRQPDGNWEIVQ